MTEPTEPDGLDAAGQGGPDAGEPAERGGAEPDGLAGAASPFLRHGAEQPVRWMPWGEAAFERARGEDLPILLDIGAVWCHWCHVMDRESYEHDATAALINERFVPVKVDRDERPDVDARYQRAVQILVGQGGWPLTAFLTPDGQVFYGGTYFPPVDRFGRPSFRRVLTEVSRVWVEDRDRVHASAGQIQERLADYEGVERASGDVDRAIADGVVQAFGRSYDHRNGGFGDAPKFPSPAGLQLLLDRHLDAGDAALREMVATTLDRMAAGGIHDQLGGGFHRYATDAAWRIPHFEKMAYDNGPLLETFALAFAALGRQSDREVVSRIVAHYAELTPELVRAGGFPASQDADVGPDDDGAYWTWTLDEIREALGGDERLVRAATLRFGLEDPSGAMPTDRSRHVLFAALSAGEVGARLGLSAEEAERVIAEVSGRLKAVRNARPRPFVDETLYAGWVALVASGHLAAARYAGEAGAEAMALRALDRIRREAWISGRGVTHRVADPMSGFLLEDQAYVARAMLDAFELTQQAPYLKLAAEIADAMLARYAGDEGGGLNDRPVDDPAAPGLLREAYQPIVDSPTPGANAVAAHTLLRLADLTGRAVYRDRAAEILEAFAGAARRLGTAVASYALALERAVLPAAHLVVVGHAVDPAAEALAREALTMYRPRLTVRRYEPGQVDRDALPPELAAMVGGEAPLAYLCVGATCAPPVDSADALRNLMTEFGR